MLEIALILVTFDNVLSQWYPPYYSPMAYGPWQPQPFYNFPQVSYFNNPFGRAASSPSIVGNWKLVKAEENGAAVTGSEKWSMTLDLVDDKADKDLDIKRHPDAIEIYGATFQVGNGLSAPLLRTKSGWKLGKFWQSLLVVDDPAEVYLRQFWNKLVDVKREQETLILVGNDQSKLIFKSLTAEGQ